MPKGKWSQPRWARAVRMPSFMWLLDFFLFPMPVVKNVSGVANASDDVLYVDTHWSRLVGMRPLAPG